MIDVIMVFALGFLTASLIALLTLPALSRRAWRLARRRLEAQFPMSLSEIAAERDHLRAELAVESRKVELKAQAVAATKAQDMAELGRRAVAIARLEEALAARTGELRDTEEKLSVSRADVAERRRELEDANAELKARGASLTDMQDTLAVLQADFARLSHIADERRIRIAALETAAEGQRARGLELEREIEALKARLSEQSQELSEARAQAAMLDRELKSAEEISRSRETAASDLRDERDRLTGEIASLTARGEADATALAAERRERQEVAAALDRLKADFETITKDYASSLDQLRFDGAEAAGALSTANADRDRLAKEVKRLTKRLKHGAAQEIADAAELRQEIQRVAADILRLTGASAAPSVAAAPVSIEQMREKKRAAKAAPLVERSV